MFYIILKKNKDRDLLIKYLNLRKIQAVTHYLPLHNSPFYHKKHDGSSCESANLFSNRLLRLPLHPYLKFDDIDNISKIIVNFFEKK